MVNVCLVFLCEQVASLDTLDSSGENLQDSFSSPEKSEVPDCNKESPEKKTETDSPEDERKSADSGGTKAGEKDDEQIAASKSKQESAPAEKDKNETEVMLGVGKNEGKTDTEDREDCQKTKASNKEEKTERQESKETVISGENETKSVAEEMKTTSVSAANRHEEMAVRNLEESLAACDPSESQKICEAQLPMTSLTQSSGLLAETVESAIEKPHIAEPLHDLTETDPSALELLTAIASITEDSERGSEDSYQMNSPNILQCIVNSDSRDSAERDNIFDSVMDDINSLNELSAGDKEQKMDLGPDVELSKVEKDNTEVITEVLQEMDKSGADAMISETEETLANNMPDPTAEEPRSLMPSCDEAMSEVVKQIADLSKSVETELCQSEMVPDSAPAMEDAKDVEEKNADATTVSADLDNDIPTQDANSQIEQETAATKEHFEDSQRKVQESGHSIAEAENKETDFKGSSTEAIVTAEVVDTAPENNSDSKDVEGKQVDNDTVTTTEKLETEEDPTIFSSRVNEETTDKSEVETSKEEVPPLADTTAEENAKSETRLKPGGSPFEIEHEVKDEDMPILEIVDEDTNKVRSSYVA